MFTAFSTVLDDSFTAFTSIIRIPLFEQTPSAKRGLSSEISDEELVLTIFLFRPQGATLPNSSMSRNMRIVTRLQSHGHQSLKVGTIAGKAHNGGDLNSRAGVDKFPNLA
jgi:hypothetical protein